VKPANVVITGGTSGIGLETAKLMAETGVGTIIVNGRDAERGETARRQIMDCAASLTVRFVQADVSTAEGAGRLFRTVGETLDAPLDVLVNSTGGDFSPELFHRTPVEHLDGIIRQWLSSRMHCCHAALPLMTRGGTIVNVGSDAAKVPTPGEVAIGAAMAGMAMFSRTLALEAKRQDIRVHMVTPSVVEGARLQARLAAGGFAARLFEKAAAAAHLGTVTGRDVAELIVFLTSPRAARMTGQIISVNGGISAG
jgi:NAD(P)-dependent dehydrogenase (short-subunit alcohol dehydrogenase family)